MDHTELSIFVRTPRPLDSVCLGDNRVARAPSDPCHVSEDPILGYEVVVD